MRTPRCLAAIAVLVCLWNAVFFQLEAGETVRARGTYPVQRPGGSGSIPRTRSAPRSTPKSIPRAQSPDPSSANQALDQQPILISAQFGGDWQPPSTSGRVHVLRGNILIEQGTNRLSARQGAVWVQSLGPQSGRQRVRIYLENDVRIEDAQSSDAKSAHVAEWITHGSLSFDIKRSEHIDMSQDAVFQRAWDNWSAKRPIGGNDAPRFDPAVQQADGSANGQNQSQLGMSTGTQDLGQLVATKPQGQRRLRFFSRSQTPFNAYSFETENTTPAEQVLVTTGGVNLVIDGVEETGTVDLRADHMVVWTQAIAGFDEQATETLVQNGDAPLQIYLEGNIVVRHNDPKQHTETTTHAQRAFFDIREKRAILQKVEVKIKTPKLPVSIRIRAEEVRQQSESSFHALDAWVTTSKFGKPGYRIEAKDVMYELRPNPAAIARNQKRQAKQDEIQLVSGEQSSDSGPILPNPEAQSGVPEPESTPWVTAVTPMFKLEDVPLLWLPTVTGPIQTISTPLRRITGENDSVFGAQIRTGWDLYKLFGREAPEGVDAVLLADYLGSRGPALGLAGQYNIENRAGWGDAKGAINGYLVHDTGVDNLGLGRRDLEPKDPLRGRFLMRDRQEFGDDFTFLTEFGYLSDRNFLEQYFESEWDTGKDNETLAYIKQQRDDWAWTAMTRGRVNDFDTTAEWLPKGDLYVLGRSLFDGRLNWSNHSSVGYGHLRPGETPSDPNDLYDPLPYVADREGLVAMTRHEISAPLHLGPVNVVPYAMGEAAYWGQGLDGNDLFRMYGSAGVRGSMMMTKVMPDVQNSILGLRGLVHKMVFDFDYSISDSSQNLSDVAQYNEFDDQAQYRFRNRLLMNTFGGVLPDQFDPRFYAVRSGAAHSVTAPYYELVDAQQVLRMAWRHRWQTQAGPIDNPRIRDWMTLDLEASYFPNAHRDNFGEAFGLIGGRYAWNFSERTSFLASAYFDLFDDAQQIANAGFLSQRGERGSMYVGVRQVKGAGLDSQILTASYSYQMSPNWISTVGTAYDLAEGRNRGQSMTVTRVGRDFLVHLGANYDASKDNFGFMLSVEPKFLPFNSANQSNPQLGSFLGGNN